MLLQIYPLLDSIQQDPLDGLPPPRVAITDADKDAQITRKDPLVADREYHTATVVVNRRITFKRPRSMNYAYWNNPRGSCLMLRNILQSDFCAYR